MNDNAGVIPRTRLTRRRVAGAVAAAVAVVMLAACGSNSSSPPSSVGHTTQAQVQARLQQDAVSFARCMRSHGVTHFPDPTSPGAIKEFVLSEIPGINAQSPAFQSAHAVCKHLLPGEGSGSQNGTEQVMAQLLQTSRCLRAHGLTGFPDPTTSPPANQANYLDIAGFSGPHAPPGAPPVAYLAIPNTINPSSPVARQAASACHFRL